MTKEDAMNAAKNISMLVFDVDGVLTDGSIRVGANGELYKPFNAHDGLGISVWHKMGGQTAIITGRESDMLTFRAKELNIQHLYQGVSPKIRVYEELKTELGLKDDEIAYVGDDLIDLAVMKACGLSFAVADAVPEAREVADVVCSTCGGRGAAREAIEFILKAKGRWEDVLAMFMTGGNKLAQ